MIKFSQRSSSLDANLENFQNFVLKNTWNPWVNVIQKTQLIICKYFLDKMKYCSSCHLSVKPAPKGTLRYIHSITGPVPVLSKTDRPGLGAGSKKDRNHGDNSGPVPGRWYYAYIVKCFLVPVSRRDRRNCCSSWGVITRFWGS